MHLYGGKIPYLVPALSHSSACVLLLKVQLRLSVQMTGECYVLSKGLVQQAGVALLTGVEHCLPLQVQAVFAAYVVLTG